MSRWRSVRLKDLCLDAGQYGLNVSAEAYAQSGVRLLRTTDISTGTLIPEDCGVFVDSVSEERFTLVAGDLLLSRSGTPPGQSYLVRPGDAGMTFAGYLVRFRPRSDVDPRFLAYVARSAPFQHTIHAESVSSTIQNFNAERYANIRFVSPDLAQQRRIADFLDAETARIDRVGRLRDSQRDLLSLLLTQLVDGALAGDSETLQKLGVETNSLGWAKGKVSRLCEVIPGYAFPSDGFSPSGKMRLLRGVNVSVDQTSWTDCVSWDEDRTPTPVRFHLRAGDLVLGMDRPWISSGMRITFIDEEDLPALLLQRVACLRPNSADIDMRYVYWSLRSSQFRQAVEGELTGVSVPHLSGDQIGGFSFPLPPISVQRTISDQLAIHSALIRKLQAAMIRQTTLLGERRQSLITAAVTGQFDVSAASGRNVTEGLPA
ncbi:restriction endonuclease subunit S [Streptomyces sp. RB6PN25]|uniref:Restriction endonuclease subunit S n=1 Tax=Streptomyces humicola TaxID=2953240 RepID=A0ABT1Q393_9ACTN|nr:restriction endonuclease subunit S [Streptomyces humicola]MCQ4084354.1 restriction endonuclease subunit S [Streptomyces humicola]